MTNTQPTEFLNGSRSLTVTNEAIIVTDQDGWIHSFYFKSPEQAHRASLAILTGPGKVDHAAFLAMADGPSKAARVLFDHFAALDARAAAEAEAAELDRRAELAQRTRYEASELTPQPWDALPDFAKNNWRAVIRALDADAEARRLHTNKETQHG